MLRWRPADPKRRAINIRLTGECSKIKNIERHSESAWKIRQKTAAKCASCAHRLKASCTGGEVLYNLLTHSDPSGVDFSEVTLLSYLGNRRQLAAFSYRDDVDYNIDAQYKDYQSKTNIDRYLRMSLGPVIPFMQETDPASYESYKSSLRTERFYKREEQRRKEYRLYKLSRTLKDYAQKLVCERMTVNGSCGFQLVGITSTCTEGVGRIYFGNYRGPLETVELKYDVIAMLIRESYHRMANPLTSKRFRVVFRKGYSGNITYKRKTYAKHRAEMMKRVAANNLVVLVDNPKNAAL